MNGVFTLRAGLIREWAREIFNVLSIATFNVNSVRQRIEHLLGWLRETNVDIACLQEIKCLDEAFPRAEIEALGYNVETHGQKTFNGVAILSKLPFDEVIRGLPGDPQDAQARYIEGVFSVGGRAIRVASIYLPNGNPAPGEKYDYKLAWMARLRAHAEDLLALEEPLALAGDYNVIPEPRDVHDPALWAQDALFLPETRAAFRSILHLGFTEAVRATTDEGKLYTFWDYQAGAWQRNNGIRIDHLLLSPEAARVLKSATIDKEMRAAEKPSDHVPVRIDLDL
jgi:exodeoxyribonuclease III